MTDICEFIAARLDEDEAAANLMAKYYPSPWEVYDRGWMARVYGGCPFWEATRLEQGPWVDNDTPPLGEIIEHVARHDPDRVLREVEAKRAILTDHLEDHIDHNCADHLKSVRFEHSGCYAIGQFAAIHADHPDYNPAWAVDTT